MLSQPVQKIREAVIENNLKTLSYYITQNNFNVYQPIDLNGLTILHYAVQLGREPIVEYLCTNMEDINLKDTLGRTPVHYAASKNEISILKLLIASQAELNNQTIGGETPLMKAITFNQVESVKLLLRYGADSSIVNKSGQSAKEIAINKKNPEIINLLALYDDVMTKLSLLVFVYLKLKDTEREGPLNKLSGNMIKTLTRYIIP